MIDARNGVVEQTKRHSFIVSLLGIQHVLVAVNKMDLMDYRQEAFEQIRGDYEAFAKLLDPKDLHFIPVSALRGDNIVDPSENMPWYHGTTLMNFLDTVYVGSDRISISAASAERLPPASCAKATRSWRCRRVRPVELPRS